MQGDGNDADALSAEARFPPCNLRVLRVSVVRVVLLVVAAAARPRCEGVKKRHASVGWDWDRRPQDGDQRRATTTKSPTVAQMGPCSNGKRSTSIAGSTR